MASTTGIAFQGTAPELRRRSFWLEKKNLILDMITRLEYNPANLGQENDNKRYDNLPLLL
jgi:hypothetical protein